MILASTILANEELPTSIDKDRKYGILPNENYKPKVSDGEPTLNGKVFKK